MTEVPGQQDFILNIVPPVEEHDVAEKQVAAAIEVPMIPSSCNCATPGIIFIAAERARKDNSEASVAFRRDLLLYRKLFFAPVTAARRFRFFDEIVKEKAVRRSKGGFLVWFVFVHLFLVRFSFSVGLIRNSETQGGTGWGPLLCVIHHSGEHFPFFSERVAYGGQIARYIAHAHRALRVRLMYIIFFREETL